MKYNEVELVNTPHQVQSFHKKSKETIQKIINCIFSRFSSFTEDEVLCAANILDPTNLPTQPTNLSQWTKIKCDISRNLKKEKFYPLWQKMLTEKEERYKNFLHLVRILLVCPVVIAHVEYQFCYIKRILGA